MKDNSAYTCVIIDDEPIAIKVIREHLENFNCIDCLGSYTKALDAIEILNKQVIDLIFLDINMPGISGIEFLKSLSNPPKVIFTTAYRNFAVDAFELEAIDYLVKPISFERFLKAINKFLAINKAVVEKKPENDRDYIILKSDKKNYKIRFEDILYVESLDNYIKVYTHEFSLICYSSLSSIEKELSANFLRIHRSHIVNVDKIDIFSSSQIEIGDKKFVIGRNYREVVMKRLNA